MNPTLYSLLKERKKFILNFLIPRKGLHEKYEFNPNFVLADLVRESIVVFFNPGDKSISIGKITQKFVGDLLVQEIYRSGNKAMLQINKIVKNDNVHGVLKPIIAEVGIDIDLGTFPHGGVEL